MSSQPSGPPRDAPPRIGCGHVVIAALIAATVVITFWFVTQLPARRAYERAKRQHTLHKLGAAVLSCEAELQRMPQSASELEPYLKDLPDVQQSLRDGKIILRLDALTVPFSLPRSDMAMAYEGLATRQRGYVVMADGAVREVTREELPRHLSDSGK